MQDVEPGGRRQRRVGRRGESGGHRPRPIPARARPSDRSTAGPPRAIIVRMTFYEFLLPTTLSEAFSLGMIVGFGIAVAGFWWRMRR